LIDRSYSDGAHLRVVRATAARCKRSEVGSTRVETAIYHIHKTYLPLSFVPVVQSINRDAKDAHHNVEVFVSAVIHIYVCR
jgi:hypothetical protein